MSKSRKVYSVVDLKYIVVHDGIFHCDDVLVVAILQLARIFLGLPLLEVIRTSKVQSDWTYENGYLVADVGLGEFDHHFSEEDKPKRANGNPYAAAGLVFAAFWPDFGLTEDEYKMIDKSYIEPLDLHDNVWTGNQLALSIKALNGLPDGWNQAIYIMKIFFSAQIQRAKEASENARKAEEAVQQIENHVIYLDEWAPVGSYPCVKESEAEFIGSPSSRGGYQITAIRLDIGKSKKLFPEIYRGKPATDKGMTFCHPAGFMACFETKEKAYAFMNWLYNDSGLND